MATNSAEGWAFPLVGWPWEERLFPARLQWEEGIASSFRAVNPNIKTVNRDIKTVNQDIKTVNQDIPQCLGTLLTLVFRALKTVIQHFKTVIHHIKAVTLNPQPSIVSPKGISSKSTKNNDPGA